MKKIKQIWIPSKRIKTSPHFPQLPSGSWRSYAQKIQLSPHIAARKKIKVVDNSYDLMVMNESWVRAPAASSISGLHNEYPYHDHLLLRDKSKKMWNLSFDELLLPSELSWVHWSHYRGFIFWKQSFHLCRKSNDDVPQKVLKTMIWELKAFLPQRVKTFPFSLTIHLFMFQPQG